MNSMELQGIGTAVPSHCIDQEDAAGKALEVSGAEGEQRRMVGLLYRRAGVATRHSVVLDSSTNGQAASQSFYPAATSAADGGPTTAERMGRYELAAWQLAKQAAVQALQDAGTEASEVSHLVTASCTGFSAPGVDLRLIEALGLPRHVARTHIGFMGCHGLLNALRVARAFTLAEPSSCVLVTSIELCTLHQQYGWNSERIVSNALFSDGAAAIVCRRSESTPRKDACWRLAHSASTVIPETAEQMTWRIRDHGFVMSLSAQVPDVIRSGLLPWMESWLGQIHLTSRDVRQWAIHPGGPRILQAVGDALGLTDRDLQASREVLRTYGNMSSATIAFVLDRFRQMGAQKPCVLLAFGPGLSIEAALLL